MSDDDDTGDDPFPAATADDWRRAAERALQGAPLDSLTWRTEDCIALPPVAADDGSHPTPATREGRVAACTTVEDGDEALGALASGFDLVRVCYDHDEQAADLGELPLRRTLLEPLDAVSTTTALHELDGAAGIVLGWWGWTFAIEQATAAQQVGWLLSAAIDVLTESDDNAAARLVLDVPVGVEIITEVAKLRALRRLWAEVADERGLRAPLRLLATCPSFPHARRDAESNLLRATLAGFAAVTGGADVVELTPYRDDDEAVRLTLQQMHVMRDEAALDAVGDPFGGAGIVERATDELTAKGRAELARLRRLGGFLAAERDGDDERLEQLAEPFEAPLRRRDEAIATRRRVIVGINRFAAPSRDAVPQADGDVNACVNGDVDADDGSDWAQPGTLLSGHAGDAPAAFEFLRDRMLWHMAAGHDRPTVLLLPLGEVGPRRARADFAADLFRAGGFEIEDPGALDSVEAAVRRARGANAVVLCGDDASYPGVAPRLAAALPGARVFVAGRPPDGADAWGAAGFVFEGLDAIEFLCALQDDLGITRQP